MNNMTTECNFVSPDELINAIREACKDIADYRPDIIEMRPDYYEFIKANSMYMEMVPLNFTPYYYGVRVEINKDLNKPFRIMRGGEEVSE